MHGHLMLMAASSAQAMAVFPASGARTVVPEQGWNGGTTGWFDYWEAPFGQESWRTYEYVGPPIPAGEYRFYGCADNGIRVLLDGAVILENWDLDALKAGPLVKIPAGSHSLVVESCNQGGPGWTEVRALSAAGAKTPIDTNGNYYLNWRR
jgi:hypothetical protein